MVQENAELVSVSIRPSGRADLIFQGCRHLASFGPLISFSLSLSSGFAPFLPSFVFSFGLVWFSFSLKDPWESLVSLPSPHQDLSP